MRKFILDKECFRILEVECKEITAAEDYSVKFLKPAEWKARILQPTMLDEQPVLCWFAFYDSIDACKEVIKRSAINSFERDKAKNPSLPDLDIDSLMAKVTVRMLGEENGPKKKA